MADPISTDVAEAPADVTTPTNEEELDPEAALEEDDVPFEESEEAKEQSEVSEPETEDTEPAAEEESEEGEAEPEEDAPAEPEAKPQSDEEKKAFNDEMARRRIEAKAERQKSIEEQQNEYLAQSEDPRDLAVRQLQVDAYTNKVESNTNKLTNGYERSIKDFPILSSDDPVIKQQVDEAIDAFQAMHVKLDAYGNPTDVSADLYQYLQNKADSIEKLTGLGARQQTTNKGKERSKTLTQPVRSPKEPKADDDLAAFDEEANRW